MTQVVTNPSADREEKIEHAAKFLRKSKQARDVFGLLYKGNKQCKSIEDMRCKIKGFNTLTYVAANRLAAENIIEKRDKSTYCKIHFYTHNRDHILRLSKNSKRLRSYPTKRKVTLLREKNIFSFRTNPQVKLISVDDIESFRKVKEISKGDLMSVKKMAERKINRGICNILKQNDKKDWGGERNDIFSTRVLIGGKRTASAFALKGRGTRGILVPKKMGKSGDQISRLFKSAAEAFFIVHNDLIDESIFDLILTHAIQKSIETRKKIFYCIIDGGDLARLVEAYPSAFN